MQYLKYRKYEGFYVKRIDTGGYSLVTIDQATTFKDGKARYFLNTVIPFKQRKDYDIIQCGRDVTPTKEAPIEKPPGKQDMEDATKVAGTVQQYAMSQFAKLKQDLEKQLNYCDSAIIDVLHFLGDENCRLNAVQLCKVAQKLQELERGHTAAKKELQRIDSIMETVGSIKEKANKFEYAPYKPKVLHNIKELID